VVNAVEAHRKGLYLLCASVLPVMVCTGIIYTILSIYLVEGLNFSKSSIGFLFALGAATGALLSPFVGKASDRLGRKPVLILSSVAFLIVFTSYAVMTELWQFLIIMLIEGVAWVSIGTGAMAYIADISPVTERGQSLGAYEATWNVGWVLGPLTGGLLADSIGFQKTFLAGASIIVVSLIMLTLTVQETAGRKKRAGSPHY